MPDRLLGALGRAPVLDEAEINGYTAAHGRSELTATELACLRGLSHGLTTGGVADLTGRGAETVKTQLRSARYKLAAKNSTHAVASAIRQGLIP